MTSHMVHDRYRLTPAHPKLLPESGMSLPARARVDLERRFGYDFSQVRVHTGQPATHLTAALGAQAVALGRDIAFAPCQYDPASSTGRSLIAHELAHVVQQARGQDGTRSALERGAERDARAALGSRPLAAPVRQALPLAEAARPLPLCYTVPGSLRCDQLADWLSRNSPYRPEWAETRCSYSFIGEASVRFTTARDGTVTARVSGNPRASVEADCPIDQPEWNPTERPNRAAELAAWNVAMRELGRHERRHRSIGMRWKNILAERYRGVSFTVTGADQAEASANAATQLETLKNDWGADAQAAQSAIDPFSVTIECPAPLEEGE